MAGVNKVILVGNLGKDPEVRHFEGGVSVAHFTLATNDYYKDKQGNRVERTEWHNISAWRGLADMADKFLKKGQPVYIEGKLRTRQYQDKDQQTRYITEIIADEISMLGGRRRARQRRADAGGRLRPSRSKPFGRSRSWTSCLFSSA